MTANFLTGPLEEAEVSFSPGVDVGDLVFVDASALDLPKLTRVQWTDSIADETNVAIDRLETTLGQAGLALSDIVKISCYISEEAFRSEFWDAFNARFAAGPLPVRVTQVCPLAGDARVLLDATAAR